MDGIVVDSIGEVGGLEGNTQEASKPLKQVSGRKHHFFTFNNYDSCDIEILRKVLDEHCFMYVFQEEVGDSGTPHLQGVCSCKKPMRDTAFGFKKIHWEKVVDIKSSYRYCSCVAKRAGSCWSKGFEAPPNLKDLDFYEWQTNLIQELTNKPDDRTVNWYWSNEGNTGKSTFTKWYIQKHHAVFCSKGKYSDIVNILYNADMNKCKTVIFDLPRNNGNKVSYDAIEAIKNGLICNTKYETGTKCFDSPHIVIFANKPPEYGNLSTDRWNVVCIGKHDQCQDTDELSM